MARNYGASITSFKGAPSLFFVPVHLSNDICQYDNIASLPDFERVNVTHRAHSESTDKTSTRLRKK